jgi:hypothetical protein
VNRTFARFACIDWSGQAVERPDGIALAMSDAPDRTPMLERPHKGWSRQAILDWLLDHAEAQSDLLIGIDFSTALPFLDRGAYFPEWSESPADVRALWRGVDTLCSSDPHLAVTSLTTHTDTRRHFRHRQGAETIVGDLFGTGMGRLRMVERICREQGHGNAISGFNLIGAAQVGKSSLTGMRVLHRLGGRIPIWPYDPIPAQGPMIVEIYTSIAARRAGLPKGRSKMRDADSLAMALAAFNLPPGAALSRYDDHSTDAILTAAWLRHVATDQRLWHPAKLTEEIIAVEGWTFGVP